MYPDRIRQLLTRSDKTTYLTGHGISFDAGRLAYEYSLLDQEPPPMLLLDNKRLAPAAQVGSHNSSQDDLAVGFGLANPARHEDNADALTAREIALKYIEKRTADGTCDLVIFSVPYPADCRAPATTSRS